MALQFSDGEVFATGSATYQYRPATPHETTPRLILDVMIEGIATGADHMKCYTFGKQILLTHAVWQ